MRKAFKYLSIAFFSLWLLINLSDLRFFLPQSYPHRYCSDKCVFWTFEKGKGRHPVEDVIDSFEYYKEQVNKPHLKLYRRFHRKWWQIWNWVDFLTNPRWSIPYAERDEDT